MLRAESSRQHGAVDLVAYATTSRAVPLPRGGSVLRHVDTILGASVGWGTMTWEPVRRHHAGHDRILIFTDEQTHDSRIRR